MTISPSLPYHTRTNRQLIGSRYRTDQRKDFFTQRVINLWNSLSQGVGRDASWVVESEIKLQLGYGNPTEFSR